MSERCESGVAPQGLDARRFGVERLGERATLVQFSSAFCQPCRATRRVLDEVAKMVRGVTHIEVDAEERLELVRELGISSTPTVLVLDAEGYVVRRASGQPRKADVIAALGEAVCAGRDGDRKTAGDLDYTPGESSA